MSRPRPHINTLFVGEPFNDHTHAHPTTSTREEDHRAPDTFFVHRKITTPFSNNRSGMGEPSSAYASAAIRAESSADDEGDGGLAETGKRISASLDDLYGIGYVVLLLLW